jgi:hypothetical protein
VIRLNAVRVPPCASTLSKHGCSRPHRARTRNNFTGTVGVKVTIATARAVCGRPLASTPTSPLALHHCDAVLPVLRSRSHKPHRALCHHRPGCSSATRPVARALRATCRFALEPALVFVETNACSRRCSHVCFLSEVAVALRPARRCCYMRLVQQFSNCSWGATRASHSVFNGVSLDV